MNGQLTPKEREFLYEAVLKSQPKIVLEVGTWKGGGSTWQIFKALEKNGSGMLYSCETDKEFFDEAHWIYKENSQVKIYNEKSCETINRLIRANLIPDFVFFDGPEDEETAFFDLFLLMPHLKNGVLFSMHDWDHPSIKANHVRPYLETSSNWTLISKLTAPESVGICLWKKIL